MDQVKIGNFLRTLRKEKALTQEQVAEQFHVSGRTVSRWENGNNMPDIGILVELSAFYNVDIREIIDGERKSETMNEEIKDTLAKVADYTDAEKEQILKKIKFSSTACVISLLIVYAICAFSLADKSDSAENLLYVALNTGLATALQSILFTVQIRSRISKNRWQKIIGIGVLVCVTVMIIAFFAVLMLIGSLFAS